MKALLLIVCVATGLLATESESTVSEADRLKAEEALARLLIEERAAEAIPSEAERPLATAEVACWEIAALLDQGRSGAAAERILAARKALAELPEDLLAQPPKRVRRVQDELLRLGSRLLLEVGLDEEEEASSEDDAASADANESSGPAEVSPHEPPLAEEVAAADQADEPAPPADEGSGATAAEGVVDPAESATRSAESEPPGEAASSAADESAVETERQLE